MKRKNQTWGLWVLSFILLLSCNRTLNPKDSNERAMPPEKESLQDRADALAKEKFKEGYQIQVNKPGTVALVSHSISPRPSSIYKTISYFLLEDASNEIIQEDVMPKATVEWINDEEIRFISVPGRGDNPKAPDTLLGYIYNVKTKTKRTLSKK